MTFGIALAVVFSAAAWSSASRLFAQDLPLTAVRFSLTLDGHEIASFSELTGITTSVDVVDYLPSRAGGRSFAATLGGPLSPNRQLVEWHDRILQNPRRPDRRTLMLLAYNDAGHEVAVCQFVNAWPAKIEVGTRKAGASEVLTESVTLVCEHIQRVSP